jgi:hypothetical protein
LQVGDLTQGPAYRETKGLFFHGSSKIVSSHCAPSLF